MKNEIFLNNIIDNVYINKMYYNLSYNYCNQSRFGVIRLNTGFQFPVINMELTGFSYIIYKFDLYNYVKKAKSIIFITNKS